MTETCKHLNFIIRDSDRIYHGFCPDCKQEVPIWIVFNNFLEAMRALLAKES
jgi:hypothetical protein